MSARRPPEPSGFFAVRTPLLPLSALTGGAGDARALLAPAALASGGDLDAAVASDRAASIARLRAQLADPAVREALFVASPSLDRAIDAWLVSPSDPRARGVAEVVARYVARMAARCTPFGLFSGCSVGTLDARTAIELAPRAEYRRHTRLDVHYLDALCDVLARDESLRARAHFRPSDGILETPTQLRYAEASHDPKTRARSYALVSVDRTAYLDAALSRARSDEGATRAEIASAVSAAADASEEEASAFVDGLVDAQLLVSDLAPVVTGVPPTDDLIATLRALDSPAVATLEAARSAIEALDASGVGAGAETYRAIAEGLRSLPVEADLARLFQVDLYKPTRRATLGENVAREIARATALVARVSPREEMKALHDFREAFQRRYEGREVPLQEALDEETGIGFASGLTESAEPSPLLEELHFPADPAPPRVAFGARERFLLRRVDDARARGAIEWALDDGDVAALDAKDAPSLPDTFGVVAIVAAASGDAVERGDFRVLLVGGAPSGTQLFGRFCHGDAELRAHVERHLRAEESSRPEAVFAEIVHLPEGRIGNILCRPVLRAHEITYLGRGGAPAERRIAASDLRVSIAKGRIVLRSVRLGREIVPRLTSAHNTATSALGVYRFLAALSSQRAPYSAWSWGALADAPFLPRVTRGRAVLALAQWNVAGAELAGLAKLSPAARFRRVHELRARHRLPRWIALAEGDHVLPLDLDDSLHLDVLASLAKARDVVSLAEVFPDASDAFVRGPEGAFVHELVVPFAHPREPEAGVDDVVRPRVASTVARRFSPGSEWLFAKLYTGTAAADGVLTRVVAPLVARARGEGIADRWFFLRYGDPDWHLRVRLHGDPARLLRDALPMLNELAAAHLGDGVVWKVQLDTYEREVERYGGDEGIDLAEAMFEADSDAVVAALAQLEPGDRSEARWRLAFRGIHLLLVDLGLDVAARARLLRAMRASYAAEHHADVALEADLGARFRARRAELEPLVAPAIDPAHPFAAAFAALDARSKTNAPIAAALRERARAGRLTCSIEELAGSLVHMHVNRVLRSEQRAQELVLCDWLARLAESEIARASKSQGAKK